MTTPVPDALKAADINRFAMRATQLEKVKPIIAYWTTLYIVETILTQGLEEKDDECKLYTAMLMDKLERWKNENDGNDAIRDDMAAEAYVEQFALETFERAEKSMHSGQTTIRTADTLQAAGTFFDLLVIWQKPTLTAEVVAKSKYAKYHAVRILRAIKAGQDPNLPPETFAPVVLPSLDPDEPLVRQLSSLQPTVEDGSEHSRASSLHSPGVKSPSDLTAFPTTSPIIPAAAPSAGVPPLEMGQSISAYSSVPTTMSSPRPATDPLSPAEQFSLPPSASALSSNAALSIDPAQFYEAQPHATGPDVPSRTMTSSTVPHPQSSLHSQIHSPVFATSPPTSFAPGPEAFNTSDESISLAAKHGKWAVSALTFDDVETAVKEFRLALQHLGAR